MQKTETLPYLVTVFPDAKSVSPKAHLQAFATAIFRELTAACGQAPTSVHSNETKLVLLVSGEHAAIVKALQKACQQHDDCWLLAQVGMPCAANGLADAQLVKAGKPLGNTATAKAMSHDQTFATPAATVSVAACAQLALDVAVFAPAF